MRAAIFGLGLMAVFAAHGEEARYLVTGAMPVPAAANGYVQEVHEVDGGGFEVRVVTSLAPIESEGSYAGILAAAAPDVPEGFELPKRSVPKTHPGSRCVGGGDRYSRVGGK